jgi:hypothetical protein
VRVIRSPISIKNLRKIAKARFGSFVKAVVDVEKEIMVLDADLHSDQEAHLIKQGSKQINLWGINLYPEIEGKDWIEFDSMINLRPSQNNLSRGVDNKAIRKRIVKIVNKLIDIDEPDRI